MIEIGNGEAKDFWERVIQYWPEEKINYSKLADICNLPNQTLRSQIMNGTFPRANTAQKIAEFLGVSLYFLLFGKDEEEEITEDEKKIDRSISLSQLIKNISILSDEQIVLLNEIISQFWNTHIN